MAEMKDQLHAIWYVQFIKLFFKWLEGQCFNRYCIPMDSPRPLLSTELEFFSKGTGNGKFNHLFVASLTAT